VQLEVTDGRGQTGQTEPLSLVLPGKRFFDPLAAAIVEMRRDLLWNRSNAPRAAQIFRAITYHPDGLIRDEKTFDRLKTAMAKLDTNAATLTPELRDELAKEFWEIALLVEEGDLASARARLERAQDRLNEAIRNGADPAEIQELMEELRAATQDYVRMLAERAQRNPDGQQAENQERMQITGNQIQEMMDEIQRLIEEGKMAEAAQAMAMLQQLLENLQITEGGAGDDGFSVPGMGALQETLRDQQDLSDESFRQLQQGDQGQGEKEEGEGGSLAERQRALRERLEGLGNRQLPGEGSEKGQQGRQALDGAEQSMDEAERALRDGDLSGALDRQAEAMDRLRQGMRALDEAAREARRADQAEQQPGGNDEPSRSRDPLGREQGDSRAIGSDSNMAQGQDVYRRAQDLLDEIRRRAGEQQRADNELGYLKRLLDLF
jgi:uncharacterized protein (TIGR02302 family)